jgi:hypothetical protein
MERLIRFHGESVLSEYKCPLPPAVNRVRLLVRSFAFLPRRPQARNPVQLLPALVVAGGLESLGARLFADAELQRDIRHSL